MPHSTLWISIFVAYLLTWGLIPWVLLKPTVHSSAAIAWIMAIIFLPFIGPLACVLFGSTRWERHSERKRFSSAHIDHRMPERTVDFKIPDTQLHPWGSIARLTQKSTGMQVLDGNAIELSANTNTTFQRMKEIIESAEHWVHLEFYIWRNDETGTKLRDLLIAKAKQGVRVRFLYDGFGSMLLSREFLRPMRRAGVQIASFTPGFEFWHIMTLNLRNHRKIIVTDQQEAYTGGMNIGHEYLHPTKHYGHWRDTQLVLRGPAATQFQQVFAQDWFYATGEQLVEETFYPMPERRGSSRAQVVADGPDSDVDTFLELAVAALGQAKRHVDMTTPFFVPPDGLAISMAAAARRGVRVRLMIAGRGNFAWTYHAGRSFYGPLLDAGVEIYEYEKGLFHAKTMTVDGQWSLVGTANWDCRSLSLNFEVAVSMYDDEPAEQLRQHFERDIQDATRLMPQQWHERSNVTRLKEQFYRLFAPVL
ncbi:cardiolipin synthase [Roseiconus nitratireducens]|uniref:Cardiolipin synthase n=1 Tax=Roseiconus nitratireducens TaxID=2605748 RepID=A0A5M6DI67_9BACT|nr:cardiolipin synthase [Roseiconus nitratireducens]KAA5545930.1 cardiolipin synthase [Roseiconus nitratireducens]